MVCSYKQKHLDQIDRKNAKKKAIIHKKNHKNKHLYALTSKNYARISVERFKLQIRQNNF